MVNYTFVEFLQKLGQNLEENKVNFTKYILSSTNNYVIKQYKLIYKNINKTKVIKLKLKINLNEPILSF